MTSHPDTPDTTPAGELVGWRAAVSRYAKFFVAALITAGTVVIGHHELPGSPLTRDLVQPTITVFASRPGVTAVVGMSASSYVPVPAGLGDTATVRGYTFNITLKVVRPAATPVTFALVLTDFPRITDVGVAALAAASPSAILEPPLGTPSVNVPRSTRGRAEYVATTAFRPVAGAFGRQRPVREPIVQVTTVQPVVSAISGPELQVTYPLVQAGAYEQQVPATEPIPGSAIAPGYEAPPGQQLANYYQPDLEAGDTQFHVNGHVNLADYATLAGDPPSVKPKGLWSWTAISDVSLLAQDALTADVAQEHLFWAGVILGVAAASGIAALVELTSAIQATRKARRQRLAARRGKAVTTGPPGGKEESAVGEPGSEDAAPQSGEAEPRVSDGPVPARPPPGLGEQPAAT
jgi:hypothetical protein